MSRTDFGSHIYWRLQTTDPGFRSFTAVAFRDETGTGIATTGGTAFDTAHSGGQPASNLFDSNNATYWESLSTHGAAVGYQFATAKKVMQVGIQRTASASQDGQTIPSEFILQYSDDGVAYVTVAWFPSGTMTNDVMKWFDLAGAL